MEKDNLSPSVQNSGKQSSPWSEIFSVRWIRILFVAILIIALFVLLNFVSNQLILLFGTVLPLFIGFGLVYLVNPLFLFFQRFFSKTASKIIVFLLLFVLILSIVVGFFILFFIRVDDLYKSLIAGRGDGEFAAFLRRVYTPINDGGIDPNNVEKIDFASLNEKQFQISVFEVGEKDPKIYSYAKDAVGGIYSLMFFFAAKIPALKNIIFGLIRLTYGWSSGSYIEWLLNNYYTFIFVLYIFVFSLLIFAFGIGKKYSFYRLIWKFFTKGQSFEVQQQLEVQLKKSLSLWLRGLLIEQMYVFTFTILFLFVVGLVFQKNSSYLSNALVLSLFMTIFNLIPYIGPWIGFVGIVGIGLVDAVHFGAEDYINWLPFAFAAGGVILVQMGQSLIVAPMVYSYHVKLSPITIIMGLAIIGVVFGFFAMPFAIPLILIVKIILRVVYKKEWNI